MSKPDPTKMFWEHACGCTMRRVPFGWIKDKYCRQHEPKISRIPQVATPFPVGPFQAQSPI